MAERMARRLGRDARHFRPNAVEKRTLRRFHSTPRSPKRNSSRHPASSLLFENFQKSVEPVQKFSLPNYLFRKNSFLFLPQENLTLKIINLQNLSSEFLKRLEK